MGKASLIIISSLVLIIFILASSLYIYSIPMSLDVKPLVRQEGGVEQLSWKITGHLNPSTEYRIWIDTWLNDEPRGALGNWELNTNLLGDFDLSYMGWWTLATGNISGNYLVQVRILVDNSLTLQKDFNFTIE